MNVRTLIEHLSKLDPELDVYTAVDAEGNSYNQVYFEPSVMFSPRDTNMHRIEEVFSEEDIEDSGYDVEDLVQVVVI